MLKNKVLALFILAALACKANPRVVADVPGSNNLKADLQQEVIVKNLVDLFEKYHYKNVPLNDSLSSVIFDRYLKNLDQGHNYLLASDVKAFERYRTTLDDDLRKGDLSTLFQMFNTFQARYNERIRYSIAQIDKDYDYNGGGTYAYDRSKMPWFASAAEADAMWTNRIRYDLLNLKIAGSDAAKNKQTLKARYENLLSQASKTNNQDAFAIMMDAFTESIDPHTNYFPPLKAQEFNEEMAKNFEGIGARLTMDNELVKIAEIINGGPAYKAKTLHANDRIIGIAQGKDGEFVDVIGWRIDNAVTKIKGPKGTVVRLKIIPAGQDLSSTPKIVELVRDRVVLEDQSAKKTIKTVTSGGKAFKIGVITIPDFYMDFKAYQKGDPDYKSTTRDVRRLLDTLKRDKVDAVVIDLRRNGGGSLPEAIQLTGLFIKSGPVVQTRDARKVEVDEDEDPGIAWEGPLGVMVDRFSASASEIFAGAIQDYGRGIIMGTQTYGKGTVQSAIDMSRVISTSDKMMLMAAAAGEKGPVHNVQKPNGGTVTMLDNTPKFGQINLTMAKFYRVTGNSTQHKGVFPDIQFPMIYSAEKYGESSEPSALPWDSIKTSKFTPFADLRQIRPVLASLHDKRMKASPEYKYLVDDIAEFNKRDDENDVTLNEAQLRKERDEQEAKALARDNQRRAAKGLPPVKKGDPKVKADPIDFVQDESLQVMADFIKLSAGDQYTLKKPIVKQ
ncbi:carboxy terminal-processing peptidase [Hufsiella ginkgonis]|nr:carboxy terminal-processing peptidase [Hufsiella ginkgonis]